MKHNAKPLILALSGLLLASCGGQPTASSSSAATGLSSVPEQSTFSETSLSSLPETSDTSSTPAPITGLGAKQRTFYQLLVYSFADGDGDGIGDFKGIVDHLDYLTKLGIGGLWLSPVLDCDSYHAYDVKDYYKINPTYEKGGVTFSKLLEECHKKGIKVLMDLVLNHSSSNCAWYSQHPSWYKTPDAFGGSMKDFNYDNQELRTEIKNVGKYWLQQGADGFRLDAAKWIYNYGGTTAGADDEKNYAWWKEFYTACQAVKSDVYMIGEVLVDNNVKDDRNYYKTGMDSNFNFEMRDVVYDAARYASPNNYVNLLENFQKEIRSYNPNGIEASCLSNHDIGRFYNFNGAEYTEAQLALAGFLNVLAPGDSYVYYGEEIGLEGTASGWQDMNYRTPMMFDGAARTNPDKYLYNVPSKVMSSSTKSGKSADAQAKASDSLFAAYAKAINAKNANPSLYSGTVKKNNNGGNSEVGSFVSTLGNTSLTVVFNCGPSQKHVTFNSDVELKGQMAFSGTFGQSGKTIGMPAYSAIIVGGDQPIAKVEASAPPVTPTSSSEQEITIDPDAFGSEVTQEKSGSLTLHVKDTNNWGGMKCYTWVSNGPNYTGSWPGAGMTKNGEWYDITISHGASNVIFNNGSNQTVDLFRNNPGEYWFVPNKGSGKVSGNWYTSNPYAA